MDDDVQDGKESEANVTVINWHVRMLRIESYRQLETLVEESLGVLLVETQMLFVPIVLERGSVSFVKYYICVKHIRVYS